LYVFFVHFEIVGQFMIFTPPAANSSNTLDFQERHQNRRLWGIHLEINLDTCRL
jgi:hypothetical protein